MLAYDWSVRYGLTANKSNEMCSSPYIVNYYLLPFFTQFACDNFDIFYCYKF